MNSITKYNDSPTTDEADIKVILLGDSAVGKSKLIERFLEDQYQPQRVRDS
jgi:Rab-like protein 2